MKIRTDFVTNSSCACFVCYKNDSKELAKALKKFLFKTNKETYDCGEDGNNCLYVDDYGIEAQYVNEYASYDCDYLDGGDDSYCPEDHEWSVRTFKVLERFSVSDKNYIFDDGKQHNNYVETENGKLYACEDISYVLFSYEQDIFNNLAYYSREQVGDDKHCGIERLKFNYPSLAKAMLLDIQDIPEDLDEYWKEEFETVKISVNNKDEFLVILNDYSLHVHSNGDIEISDSLRLPLSYYCSNCGGYIEYDCWSQKSCNSCFRKLEFDDSDDGCEIYYDYLNYFEHCNLECILEPLGIYFENVSGVLEDGTVVTNEVYYKDVNGKYFALKSPEVKPIGHIEHIYDKKFYILYDKDNEIVDLFYEEDLQKFVEEKSLTIDDKKKNIYEQGKLVYTVKCTTLDKLMRENCGESHLECGSTD